MFHRFSYRGGQLSWSHLVLTLCTLLIGIELAQGQDHRPLMASSHSNSETSQWYENEPFIGNNGQLWLNPRNGNTWCSFDYLLWSIGSADAPPLITASPSGTAPAQTGVLGGRTTTLNSGLDDPLASGFRLSKGWTFDPADRSGVELRFTWLPSQSETKHYDSNTFPLLARPVFDTLTGSESAKLVAHPDFLRGNIAINRESELHFFDILLHQRSITTQTFRANSLIGFRYGSLEGDLSINDSSRYIVGQGGIIQGTTVESFDRFSTRNQFFGVSVGFDYHERLGCWEFDVRGLVNLGVNNAKVTIDGSTVTRVPGAGEATFNGGLLAQETNMGTRSSSQFSAMPEIYIGARRPLNACWEFSIGYHALYWGNAVQPEGQIDRNVSQFPPEPSTGSGAPRSLFSTDGVFVHGLQTGLVYRF